MHSTPVSFDCAGVSIGSRFCVCVTYVCPYESDGNMYVAKGVIGRKFTANLWQIVYTSLKLYVIFYIPFSMSASFRYFYTYFQQQ